MATPTRQLFAGIGADFNIRLCMRIDRRRAAARCLGAAFPASISMKAMPIIHYAALKGRRNRRHNISPDAHRLSRMAYFICVFFGRQPGRMRWHIKSSCDIDYGNAATSCGMKYGNFAAFLRARRIYHFIASAAHCRCRVVTSPFSVSLQ